MGTKLGTKAAQHLIKMFAANSRSDGAYSDIYVNSNPLQNGIRNTFYANTTFDKTGFYPRFTVVRDGRTTPLIFAQEILFYTN